MHALACARRVSLVVLLLASAMFALAFPAPLAAQGPLTRDDILEVAEAYATHPWTPYADGRNIYHGSWEASAGVWWPSDTPNTPYRTWGWATDKTNTGVPYQWGGFSSIRAADLDLPHVEDFDKQVTDGKYAGDITYHRQLVGEKWVTKSEFTSACGVDCSGFVSQCWKLSDKHSTHTLLRVARPILFADLKPGDILDNSGHVMLFKEWLNGEHTSFRVYEASTKDGRVSEQDYAVVRIIDGPGVINAQGAWEVQNNPGYGAVVKWSNTEYQYWAYSRFAAVDLVLVIDRSGSMGTSKMNAAKNAAKMFVDLMRTGDKVGVVDFDDRVTVTYALTEIGADRAAAQAAKGAIDSLSARGNTTVGGGLQTAQAQLNSLGRQGSTRVMVLLSDGQENTDPMAADVLPGIIQDNMVVYSIGLGQDADQRLLQDIAKQTGGLYAFSPGSEQLQEIYNRISAALYGQSVVRAQAGTVSAGGVAQQAVKIDSNLSQATFSLTWPGSDLDLVLVQPDGGVIDPARAASDPHIDYVEGNTYEFYRVETPQRGEWTMRVIAISVTGAEDYVASVMASDTMFYSAKTDQATYRAGQAMVVRVGIYDDGGIDMPDPRPVLGAIVTAEITNPAQQSFFIALHDDGAHGDGGANDGAYANTFATTAVEGSYTIVARASGNNNRDGQAFTRETTLSAVVSGGAPFTWVKEAEDGAIVHPMALTADPQASACDYVYSVRSSFAAPGVGSASYTFNAPRAETYYLWARVLALDWNHNSFFVSLDGAAPVVHEILEAEAPWYNWAWERVELFDDPIHGLPLQAGTHTLVFAGREEGARLDALVITNDALYRPSGVLTSCLGQAPAAYLPLILSRAYRSAAAP